MWKLKGLRSFPAAMLAISVLGLSFPADVSAASEAASCTNNAVFVRDVTVPDNTKVQTGSSIEKVWRLKNTGTCTWSTSYAVAFTRGSRMSAPWSVALPISVAPGSTVDVKVNMTAPSSSGTHRGDWRLKSSSGDWFGENFWVQVVVARPTSPTPGPTSGLQWRGQYFANSELRGSPTLARTDKAIDFDWGSGSPGAGIPRDYFSARWTAKPTFDAGTYRFRVKADTGARLYVDGKLVLDAWRFAKNSLWTVDVELSKGRHEIRLDYREVTGDAAVRLTWEKVKKVSYSHWKGEYFPNDSLARSPALVRNDKNINFNWDSGAPASGLPADNFSVRWTRTMNFTPGTYRLTARADDGVRVYVDGVLVIDKWNSAWSTTHTADVELDGKHQIVVRYVERSKRARVAFSWQMLAETPAPTPAETTPAPTTELPTTEPPTMTPEPTATDIPVDQPQEAAQ